MYEANKDYGTDIKVRYVTGQNKLSPMSVFFFHRHNVKFPNFS